MPTGLRVIPVEPVLIDDIKEFDENCWFGDGPVTCRMVAQHVDRINTVRFPTDPKPDYIKPHD